MKIFEMTSGEADFDSLKKEGVDSLIFPEKQIDEKTLLRAFSEKLNLLICLQEMKSDRCLYAGRDGIYEGNFYRAAEENLSSLTKRLGGTFDIINGFVIPVPCFAGLFFDDEMYEGYRDAFDGEITDGLEEIFDIENEVSKLRIRYYETAQRIIFERFIAPLDKFLKKCGKTAYFDFGDISKNCDYVRKMVNPYRFMREKVSFISKSGGEVYTEQEKSQNAEVLFVTPMRGIMERYAWGGRYSTKESELLIASLEERYFKESLEKCGIAYEITDEASVSELDISGFRELLISEYCVFGNSEAEGLKKLKDKGIKINSEELLRRLDSVN